MPTDAKARAIQALTDLYPDQAIRQARLDELGESGLLSLGNLVLRQDDYSRSMNELGTQRQTLQTKEAEAQALYDSNRLWFEQKQADLAELDRLRQGIVKPANGAPDPAKPADPNYLTKEAFTSALAETERGAVAFFNDLNTLSLQHYQQFGEILDTNRLLTDKRVQQLGLRGVYADLHKPQLDERAARIRQEAEDKIRLDERTKVLASQASQHHPYPIRGNEPSTLDALEAARTAGHPFQAKTVDEMAQEYARLSASRATTG